MKSLEYYMNLPYKLEIVPDLDEGGYVARYPELPGCITVGNIASICLQEMMLWRKRKRKGLVLDNRILEMNGYMGCVSVNNGGAFLLYPSLGMV